MANETRKLAAFASALALTDIPDDVLLRAKQCIADTIAAIIFGARLPWSRIVAAQARQDGAGGGAAIIGSPGAKLQPGAAALATGTAAHAFELDSLRRPGAGVHPGATLVPPTIALAQHLGKGGTEVLLAFVAGCEVQFRIGDATRHSAESRGFHAPGLTGPLGAAAAAAKLLGLDAEATTSALGIAGSLAGGLLEFASAGSGGMVKRLHLGRAAQSGILAADLAQKGFSGPATVLEGPNGFLRAFCPESDPERLAKGLMQTWETRKICFKRYPCHITAQAPIEAARALAAAHRFAVADIAAIEIRGSEKMATLHNIPRPADLIMAQYSIPWSVAASLVGDPDDPESFSQRAYDNPGVAELAARGVVTADAPAGLSGWGAEVTLRLADGRALTALCDDFPGTPERPFTTAELRGKFLALARGLPDAGTCFDRLMAIEREDPLDWLIGA